MQVVLAESHNLNFFVKVRYSTPEETQIAILFSYNRDLVIVPFILFIHTCQI